MTDEIRRSLDKADHALVVSEDLMEQGHIPDDVKGKGIRN